MKNDIKNVLTTTNLVKKYKDHVAVNNVNLTINSGDIYGFVGENGAGKTTVIRMITGLAKPTSGSYSLFGISNNDKKISIAKSKTAAIIENVKLCGNMTAIENLKLQCLLTNVKKTEQELIDLITLVGLDYKLVSKKKTKDFSLGMRQRMGIAITMLSSPEFIILDEPLNGLDPQGFIDVRETIVKLAKEKNVTFLISSHVLSELDKICTKVCFISHGNILEEISIDELHNKARERIEINFKNIKDLNVIKKNLKSKHKIKDIKEESNNLVIYDKIDINKVIKLIYESNIKINHINKIQSTIEDYYMNVLKRGI